MSKCVTCETVFPHPNMLQRHRKSPCIIITEREKSDLICELCNRPETSEFFKFVSNFTTKTSMIDIITSHKKMCFIKSRTTETYTKRQLRTCGGCHSAFTDTKAYIEHVSFFQIRCNLILPKEIKTGACFYCEKSFLSIENAQDHIESACERAYINLKPKMKAKWTKEWETQKRNSENVAFKQRDQILRNRLARQTKNKPKPIEKRHKMEKRKLSSLVLDAILENESGKTKYCMKDGKIMIKKADDLEQTIIPGKERSWSKFKTKICKIVSVY